MRAYQSIVIFLLAAGAFILIPRAPHSPSPEAARIRLALSDGVLITDFLHALAGVTGEPVLWSARCKEIRGKRITGEIVLQGSKQAVLSDAGCLLTFYELKMVSVGPTHARAHVVTRDAHTCGLHAGD